MCRISAIVQWLRVLSCALVFGFSLPVFAGNGPTVSLTSPSNGATFTAPASVTLTASASENNGTIVKVDFYSGSTLLGTVTSSPYTLSWNNVGAGSYTLTAKATDGAGRSTTSSAVSITVNIPFNNGPINLDYDELGRLVGFTDGIGNTSTYNYDALGNMTAVGSVPTGQVAIIEFTPNSGPVGTSVTISGSGFSTTLGQNTVTFNGTTATVTSATTTQLVAQVPTGSTTGPISVTTPNGTATSSASFNVGSATAPTLSGFTPTIGPVGTAVTIAGSNFEPVASNNRVEFNSRPAPVFSSTATSIVTSVGANDTSGKISVTTPNGQAISTQDFYVVPSPYAASDIEFTGRMTVGSSQPVTITGTGKKGLMLFDAQAGQRVVLVTSNVTFGSCVNVTIYQPDGTTLYSSCMWNNSFNDPPPVLTQTGTYAIFVNPQNSQTGSVTLNLNTVPLDFTGTITVDGPSVTVTTTAPGQNGTLTFSGVSGQRVALQAASSTYPSGADVTIYRPAADGSASTSNGAIYGAGWGSGSWTDVLTLPASGTYTIFINPPGTTTGSMTFNLFSVPPDGTGAITVDGGPVSVTTTGAGQNAVLTFNGSFGQRLALQATSSTYPSGADVTIYRPAADGSASTSNGAIYGAGWGSGSWTDVLTLPANGTYTIFINPPGTTNGGMTLNLFSVPPDVTGMITVNGGPVSVTTGSAGQNASLTYSGSAGQQVTLQATSSTYPSGADVTIYRPAADGSASTNNGAIYGAGWGSGSSTGSLTLPTVGTYTIYMNPPGTTTGSMTFNLTGQ